MESSVHNQWRPIWTNSHVLQTNQLFSHLPNNDEHHLLRPHWWRKHHNLHGQHSNTHRTKARRNPQRTCEMAQGTSITCTQTTKNEQPPSQPGKMHIWARTPWLSGSTHRRRIGPDGTVKGQPSQELDPSLEHLRSPEVPQLHWLLPVLHPRVLTNCQTIARPHKTSNDMALGWERTISIWNPEGQNGQQTYSTATYTSNMRQNSQYT